MMRFSLFYIAFVFLPLRFFAQPSYFFWQYTSQNGLISSDVTCITQDSKGYLWIGSDIGLSKFDGTSFSNYNIFDDLARNEIREIISLEAEKLIIIHQDGSNTLLEGGKFKPNFYPFDSIIGISKTKNPSEPILILKNSIVFYKYSQPKEIKFSPPNGEYITEVVLVNEKEVFISTKLNSYLCDISNNKIQIKQEIAIPALKVIQYLDYYYVFNTTSLTVLDAYFSPIKTENTSFNFNSFIWYDSFPLIATSSGIYEIRDLTIQKYLDQQNNLPENNITSVFRDKEKTLWIGTKENGILGLPIDHFPVISYNKDYGSLVSHISQQEPGPYKVSNNYLIFDHAIIQLLDLAGNHNIIYRNNLRKITAYYETPDQEKWIGTTNGLFITFPGTNIEYEFKELKNQHILYIRKMEQDNIIVITKQSAFVYHPSSNRIVSLFSPDIKNKFSNITSVIRFYDELLLFGKGNILRLKNLKITSFFKWDDPNISSISFTYLSNKWNTTREFWIGTFGKGIIDYKSENNYSFFTDKNEFPFKYIYSTNQVKNILWVASNKGLVKLNLENKQYKIYNQKYFSHYEILTQPSLYPSLNENNIFYLLSKKGLIKVNPERFKSEILPKLSITGFDVSGRAISVDSTINLQYDKYPISISFDATSLSDKVYFQYRLINFQEKWSQPTTQKTIEFLDLPPNTYTFEVRLVNPITKWYGEVKTLQFVIDIPFWKTTTFFILVAIGLALFLALLYVGRIIRLKVQQKKLQNQVDRKTFQLSLQKKHLEQLSYSLSHDLKNPVNNIKGLVEILEEDRSDGIIKMLGESTEILENKILSTLSSIKKAQSNTKEIVEIKFDKITDRVKKSLLMLIKENNANIKTSFNVPSIFYEESLIESIVYNLVSNAIKYKHPDRDPYIEITTEKVNEYIKLSVKDNGLGLDVKRDKEAIFSIFKRVHKNAEGTGIGLYMIKQMVEINGGSIDLESEPQVGTTFFVYLKDLNDK